MATVHSSISLRPQNCGPSEPELRLLVSRGLPAQHSDHHGAGSGSCFATVRTIAGDFCDFLLLQYIL